MSLSIFAPYHVSLVVDERVQTAWMPPSASIPAPSDRYLSGGRIGPPLPSRLLVMKLAPSGSRSATAENDRGEEVGEKTGLDRACSRRGISLAREPANRVAARWVALFYRRLRAPDARNLGVPG